VRNQRDSDIESFTDQPDDGKIDDRRVSPIARKTVSGGKV